MENNFTKRPAAIAAVLLLAAGLAACGEGPERSDTLAKADAESAPAVTTQPAAPATQANDQVAGNNDEGITEAVKSALAKEANLDAANLAVTTQDGMVTLSGRAPDNGKAEHAKSVAQAVPGVVSVDNRIDISG